MKKISSNSFRVQVVINSAAVAKDNFCLNEDFVASRTPIPVCADDFVEFRIDWDLLDYAVIIRLGNEVIEEIAGGKTRNNAGAEKWFQGYLGESSLTVELLDDDKGKNWIIYQRDLLIEPRPETLQDFKIMVDDLVNIHEGMAQDVVSRVGLRKTFQKENHERLLPSSMLEKLQNLWLRISEGIDLISVQPSNMLVKKTIRASYRPSDRITVGTLNSIVCAGILTPDRRGLTDPGAKILVDRPALDEDIPEHRHIAFRIRRLARIANRIDFYCERTMVYIEADKKKWGERRYNQQSVYEQVGLPRVKQLRAYSQEAQSLAKRFSGLVKNNSFLENAGQPRTPFGLTPLFYGRPAYTTVYKALRDAEKIFGGMVDGDAVLIHFRNIATIYEYWCFMKVVMRVRNLFGPPEPFAAFKVVDEVYCPQFTSGQFFEFNAGAGRKIRVTYEPEIKPWNDARLSKEALGATLTTRPLRPDIFIEIISPDGSISAMVMDGKSGEQFNRQKLKDISDYSRQILDIKGGTQPVRHVFLLHRDRRKNAETNIPGYLEGYGRAENLHVIGALACVPSLDGRLDQLDMALKAFWAVNNLIIPLKVAV